MEADKDDFSFHPDIDGTINGYIDVILDFSFLNVFGLVYPLSFPLLLVMNLLRINLYKVRLMYGFKRPLPKSCSNIGIFKTFMLLSSYISILSYSAIICFTSRILLIIEWDDMDNIISTEPVTGADFSLTFVFIGLVIIFFVIKYLIDTVYNNIDEGTNNMIKR